MGPVPGPATGSDGRVGHNGGRLSSQKVTRAKPTTTVLVVTTLTRAVLLTPLVKTKPSSSHVDLVRKTPIVLLSGDSSDSGVWRVTGRNPGPLTGSVSSLLLLLTTSVPE